MINSRQRTLAGESLYDDNGAEDVEVTDKRCGIYTDICRKIRKIRRLISVLTTKDRIKICQRKRSRLRVKVLDPEEEDIALKVAKKASIHVKANDTLQKYGIHLIKTDQDGNKLAGAIFALKAKTDIVNSKGENIFKKG